MSATRPSRVVDEFRVFFEEFESKLSYALTAAYGVEVGAESSAEAIAYAWEHWAKVGRMDNPAGYLYRVGQTAARRLKRKAPLFPEVEQRELPMVEPGLPKALARLSAAQRTAVVLLYVLDWSEREAADLLGVNRSTIRRHRDRGLAKLRQALEVDAGG